MPSRPTTPGEPASPADLPDRMRAAVLTAHGGPEVLQLRDVPAPTPGPGEVVVRTAAAALNNTDLWTREGAYGLPGPPGGWLGPLELPRIQGGDVAGTVVAAGDGVPADLLGRRVLVDPATYGSDAPDATPVGYLGSEQDGGFAELVRVAAPRAHPVDGSPLRDVELACLPVAYGTALGMLERGGVTAGHTVLVTGASGGVGIALVQLATARGARVVAVTSGASVEAVRAAGADVVVDRGAGDVVEALRDARLGGIDVALDVVAGPQLPRALDLLRDSGRWVVSGALAGHDLDLDVRRLYLRSLALVGSSMHTRRHFELLADLARSGAVRPLVAATYDLADIARAQADLESRHLVGKLVITF